MERQKYESIQAGLGAIGDSFNMDCKNLIALSNVDSETKELIDKICRSICSHFNETALLISHIADMTIE